MIRMKGESFAIACNRSLVFLIKIPPRMGGNLIVFVRFVFSFFFRLIIIKIPPRMGGNLIVFVRIVFSFFFRLIILLFVPPFRVFRNSSETAGPIIMKLSQVMRLLLI